MTMEQQVLVNVADITQKLRGARVYNEQSNTSPIRNVNSLVMTSRLTRNR
jgi:hypothetical protein